MELCTIIAAPRDTFTRLENSLANILKFTPPPVDVICAAGGMPESVRRRLETLYKDKVRFIFKPEFMTNAQLRNIGLREAKTKLAVCLDSDVFVRPGWFEPLVRCQQETGALMVTPIVLDRQSLIHTAGNKLYILEELGKKYGVPHLEYVNLPFSGKSNIPRHEIDFAEVHCQLVQVRPALELGIYDENIREGHCIDSGLTIRKAGQKVVVEPGSVVYLHYPQLQDRAKDIALYRWKWDVGAVMRGFDYLEKKWGIDFVSKSGMKKFMVMLNHRVGFCTLLWPSRASIAVDRFYFDVKKGLASSLGLWRKFKNRVLGFGNTQA